MLLPPSAPSVKSLKWWNFETVMGGFDMNDMGWEKWYPLTYPGYYGEDLEEFPSLCCEHCRLELSRFYGQTIGLQAVSGEGCCMLVGTDGKILERWKSAPETLLVPEEARYLYLNNNYDENSDFYILVPKDVSRKPTSLLFREDFTCGAVLDGNDFIGASPAEQCTAEGLLLPLGIENALVLQKSTALDDWSMTAEFTAPLGTESVCLGTRITQGRPCKHASL